MLHEDELHKLPCKQYIYLALAKQLFTSVEQVSSIVDYCINVCELFQSDNIFFWSERVIRNISKRTEISNKRSRAGKISAESRKNTTSVEHVSTNVEQNSTNGNKGKESKVKESKVNNIEENNIISADIFSNDLNNPNLTGKEEDEKLKAEFDVFRKKYPGGSKGGIDTEWEYFTKKVKDYKKVAPILNESLDITIQRRNEKKKLNLFLADWKNFRTWINGRCWEHAFNESESDIQAKKELSVELGYGEFIKDGIRTYGSGKVSVPMDAPKRPSNNYAWSDVSKQWVYLV